MSEPQAALIWCPFPDSAQARDCLATLIAEQLVACGNIIPGVQSLFAWEGGVSEASEAILFAKTTPERHQAAIDRLDSLHSYVTPAIVGWLAGAISGNTASWLSEILPTGAHDE